MFLCDGGLHGVFVTTEYQCEGDDARIELMVHLGKVDVMLGFKIVT